MAISQDVIARLRMLGASAFSASATGAAKSVESIGAAEDRVARKSGAFGRSLRKTEGAFTLMGTASTRLAQGVGLAGASALAMGVKFDAGMEQSTVAFTNLLGSSEKAHDMLDELYTLAAKTPFEFPQLTAATQRLIGFGMSAKKVVPTMRAVGDAVAAAGGSSDQIAKVSLALGQIQAKGRVSTEELLQMAESGVPAMKILQQELGITGETLDEKLKKHLISADVGIAALVKGMNKRYKGSAAAQSKTFNGMLSTLKDNVNQTLGIMAAPLFGILRKQVLPAVNDVTNAIAKWARGGGVSQAFEALRAGFSSRTSSETQGFAGALGKVAGVGRILGIAFRGVKDYFGQFMQAVKPAMPFVRNVMLPLLKGIGIGLLGSVVGALRVAIPVFHALAVALGWVGTKLAPFKIWIERIGIVIGVVFGPAILRAIGMLGRFGGVFRIVAGAAKIALFILKVYLTPLRLIAKLGMAAARVMGSLAGKLKGPLTAAFKGAISLGKNLVRGFGRLGVGIVKALISGITSTPGAIVRALKGLLPGGKVGKVLGKVIGFPGAAAGGTISRAGRVLVGERGPELLDLPRSARVTPLAAPSVAPVIDSGSVGGMFVAKLYLQNREIAQAVAQHTADVQARR